MGQPMDTEDDAPLFPLIGYTAGIIDGAIAVRLEYATTRAEYAGRSGPSIQFVMSPAAALELAAALQERGQLAMPADKTDA
jgi:hypothetical protein